MFDSVVDLDAELVAQGFEQGVERSQRLANEEVYCLGLTKGKELGVEIGFYRGVVRAFEGLLNQPKHQSDSDASACETTSDTSSRVLDSETIRIVTKKFSSSATAQAWTALHKMVLEFPVDEPLSQENHDVMLAIRSKYKVLTTRLGIEPLWPSELGVGSAGASSSLADTTSTSKNTSDGIVPTAANAHTLFLMGSLPA